MVVMKGKRVNVIRIAGLYGIAIGCFVASLFEPWGKQGDVLLVILGTVVLIVAAYGQYKWQNDKANDNADELLSCMNMKRHDWLNHIQVMLGYLSLNKYDRLQAYLQKIMAEAEQESHMCHLGYAPLSHYLLTRPMNKPNVLIDLHIVPDCKVHSERQGERLLNTIREVERLLVQTCRPSAGETLTIGMTLAAHASDIMVYIDIPDQTNVQRELKRGDWTKLCHKVLSQNGEVFLEGEAAVMECTVRIS